MKKTSLANAMKTFEPVRRGGVPVHRAGEPAPVHRAGAPPSVAQTVSGVAPSRVGKKAIIGYFDPTVSDQLNQMKLDHRTTVQAMLAEALNDFFTKYNKPTIA